LAEPATMAQAPTASSPNDSKRGGVASVKRIYELQKQQPSASSTSGPSVSASIDVRAFEVHKFNRWGARARRFLGITRSPAAHDPVLYIESTEEDTRAFEAPDISSVQRLRNPRRMRISIKSYKPWPIQIEFKSESECNEALAALSQAPTKAAPQELKLVAATWNMGNALPEGSLTGWLRPGADLYAIGIQEAGKGPLDLTSGQVEASIALIERACGDGHERVALASMGQIHLLILAASPIVSFISSIEDARCATGVAGVGTNKGAVAVSLLVCNTSVCFVNAHLAAHQEKVKERNAQFCEIQRECKLGRKTVTSKMDLSNRFEHIVWVGDLNYRIDMERDEVLQLVRQREWAHLYQHDQLKFQMETGVALSGFSEGKIDFAPTFKHIPGRAVAGGEAARPYDEKKLRVPSWCDRVLCRSWPGSVGRLTREWYTSAPELITSDHVPVSAAFSLDVSPKGKNAVPIGQPVEIVLSNLAATGIDGGALSPSDPNGLADPYLEVIPEFGDAPSETSVLKRTLVPRWEGEEIRLKLPEYRDDYRRSCEYLDEAHIFVMLKDHDRYSRDDVMGSVVISCAGLLQRLESTKTPRTSASVKSHGSSTARRRGGGLTARNIDIAEGKDFAVPFTRDGLPLGVITGRIRAEVRATPGLSLAKLTAYVGFQQASHRSQRSQHTGRATATEAGRASASRPVEQTQQTI